ncbi:MAG: hypothetical protein BWK80_52510 [Desulfobacteraceae bacterium IS3]|nr:MAG: hypothetical protein BWK80_52510 [Desulfobacteraceae bacterium IS3]
MPEKKRQDKIRLFCEGKYESFQNIPCRYYIRSDRACRLLRAQKTEAFWKKCRVNSIELIYRAVNRYLFIFKKRYYYIPIDEHEDIDFAAIIGRLKKQTLKKDTLISWIAYVNITAFREVRHYLHAKYAIPEKRTCGSCIAFPGSPPYICTLKGEERKKTDLPCESYAWKPPLVVTPGVINEETDIPDPSSENKEEEFGDEVLSCITDLLIERFKAHAPGSKKREVCKRQYEIFVAFLHELSEIEPASDLKDMIKQRPDMIKKLANDFGVDEKTVRRDIQEVREFLKEKMSLCFEKSFLSEQGGDRNE